jgi:nicotinate-nucleotide adenylyltransferase
MNIAILGGSFDPPHLGHYFIIIQVKELLQMDEIWLMPVFTHPFQKELLPVADRLAMTKLLCNDYIKISDFEIKNNQSSFTINTLTSLEKLHPEHTFHWIIGSDQLNSFQKYKDWQELIRKYNIIIFPREYVISHLEEKVKESFTLQTIPQNVKVLHDERMLLTNISSSKVRQRVKKGLPIHHLVPNSVESYIYEHGLYK